MATEEESDPGGISWKHFSIFQLTDLCLHRVSTNSGRHPFQSRRLRRLVKDYLYMTLTDETIRVAVDLYLNSSPEHPDLVFGPIELWDTHAVTNMHSLFRGCTFFNADISGWDVQRVTTMQSMFQDANTFNQPLNTWNIHHVIDLSHCFQEAWSFNQPLDTWKVEQVTTMAYMFYRAKAFNQPIATWDVRHVTTMEAMFLAARSFNQPIEAWSMSNVSNVMHMLSGATSFNQPLNNWDVRHLRSMCFVLSRTAFNQPLDRWDVSNVRFFCGLFAEATAFNQPLEAWSVQPRANVHSMFYRASALNVPRPWWVTDERLTTIFADPETIGDIDNVSEDEEEDEEDEAYEEGGAEEGRRGDAAVYAVGNEQSKGDDEDVNDELAQLAADTRYSTYEEAEYGAEERATRVVGDIYADRRYHHDDLDAAQRDNKGAATAGGLKDIGDDDSSQGSWGERFGCR